jgi:hypothetical protein
MFNRADYLTLEPCRAHRSAQSAGPTTTQGRNQIDRAIRMVAKERRAAATVFLLSPQSIRRGIEILLVVFTAMV